MRVCGRLQFWILLSIPLFSLSALPQSGVRPRITSTVNDAKLTTLHFNTHPLAKPQADVGAAPATLPLQRMLLVLKRSPEQAHALAGLLDQLQDKSAPSFHQWMTPDQFGQQFGPADSDIQAVITWLQSHGFQVNEVFRGRTVIEFSGTAGQVQSAFHTSIHKYVVDGEEHWANSSDPQIPTALAPVVAGVATLHNFFKKPHLHMAPQPIPFKHDPNAIPQNTFPDGSHYLGPGDYATIYNINPLYVGGINGAGSSIAVVARTDIIQSDITDFQGLFGITNPPQVVLNGPDPGNLGGIEEAEALLDTTWSTSIATGAAVQLVISASTDTTDGVDLSELYIIDHNLADVMTESFGSCEAFFTQSDADLVSSLAQQAAAQGISYFVSTGDSGASGCDRPSSTIGSGTLSVNLLASSPYTTAVGGTMFNEHGQDATYWNSTPVGVGATARSYIPENVWNESCSVAGCGAANANLAAGGGGVSQFFAKPSWQAGVAGIPADGHRDLPDVSLTAAGHDPYLLCYEFSCENNQIFGISGTSASTPSFAGIMALIDQQMGGRQGQANYVLYRLAATETLSQCNGSKTTALPAVTCIFNDTTVGNIAVPGQAGFGTTAGKYQTTTGYDLATGLGSVNVNNLATQWSTVSFNSTLTSLTLAPTTIAHGSAVTVTAAVTHTGGAGTPTGTIVLQGPSGTTAIDQFNLAAGAVNGTTNLLPGGTYDVTAHYSGDGSFGSSDSAPVNVTVTPEASVTTLSVLTIDGSGNTVAFAGGPYGSFVYPRADVAGLSGKGTATGSVAFSDGAVPLNTFTLNSEGNAAIPNGLTSLLPGTHVIGASYSGDSSFNPSISSTIAFDITQAPTSTVLTADQTTVSGGAPVNLTATISTDSFSSLGPQGVVTFTFGSAAIGTAPLIADTDPQTGKAFAVATLSTTTLAPGANVITASFAGDTNYLASTSSPVTVTVHPEFSLGVDQQDQTVPAGSSGIFHLTVTGNAGYAGTINFTSTSCSGIPNESTCSFNPASITGSGTTTITVTTTGSHHAALLPARRTLFYASWTAAGGLMLGIFMFPGASNRRRTGLLSVLALAFLLGGTSCGGDSGHTDPGTNPGTYTISVTAKSGTLVHIATFHLTVQ